MGRHSRQPVASTQGEDDLCHRGDQGDYLTWRFIENNLCPDIVSELKSFSCGGQSNSKTTTNEQQTKKI
jgi:hypothetical protein